MPSASQIQHEVDILDVMKRLRNALAGLDNCSFLVNRTKALNDPELDELVAQTVEKIAQATESINSVIKRTESNSTYKDLVKRYRNPTHHQDE